MIVCPHIAGSEIRALTTWRTRRRVIALQHGRRLDAAVVNHELEETWRWDMANRIKLSCTDFTFGLLPHEDALALIRMLGLDGVDIGVFGADAHTTPRDVTRNVSKAARQLRAKLKRTGLALADVYLIPGTEWTLSPNHPDARVRRRSRDLFERILEYTVRSGGHHMTSLPGMPFKDVPRGESVERSADELAWRVDRAEQAGVVFAVEPHIGSISSTPAQTQRLLEKTPGLTLALDYSHFIAQGIAQRTVEPLLKHASHFHARGAARKRRQTAVKDNTIDYSRIVRQMKRQRYSGYISFEFEYFDADPGNEVDTLSETILLRDIIKKALARV